MTLTTFIHQQRQHKPILLMSHAVLGYPSWEDNRHAIAALVEADVELIELQFPFSEPIADGPILMAANHASVQSGTTVQACFQFAAEVTQQYPQTRFLIMTYVNILVQYGLRDFINTAAQSGIAGCIIPDLPPEAAAVYLQVSREQKLATIFLVTPENRLQRLQHIISCTSGMVYCVARKGVTGHPTHFSQVLSEYLTRVCQNTSLPVGVGFGIQTPNDVSCLMGQVDVAVVCTQAVKYYVDQGAHALGQYMRNLRGGYS